MNDSNKKSLIEEEDTPLPNSDIAFDDDKCVVLHNDNLHVTIKDDRASRVSIHASNFMCFCMGVSVGCGMFSFALLFLPH